MPTEQVLYLALIVAAFAVFALVVAGADWYESGTRPKPAVKVNSSSPKGESPREASPAPARELAA